MAEQVKKNEDVSFLDEVAGAGFEGMGTDEVTVPRLLISQQLSDVVSTGSIQAGHFYNSVTGKDYGTELNVIPCSFQKVWVEWKPNNEGYVGTYGVGELDVTGDAYSGLKHGENDVIETYTYLIILPDHLDDGYMIFQSTRGNMKYLKAWNTQMKYLRTPGGKPAPLFSSTWKLALNKDQNKKGNTYYSCNENGKSSIKWISWVTKDMFTDYVQPATLVSKEAIAIADNTSAPAIEAF